MVVERSVCYNRSIVKYFLDIRSDYVGMSSDK